MNYHVHFLDRQEAFDEAFQNLGDNEWIGFDTEFVGEKTYIPVLCLIQVVTEHDIFLIDTLAIKNIRPFLDIVQNPKVLKITHAGDNDYRLLHTLYGVVPQNTFDTQIAAGFVGYNYPAGFGKIVERELNITLAKSHTVADWEARPLDPKAIDYAIEDVKFLPRLHYKLSNKLKKRQRENWAREENLKWENAAFYAVDPNKEALANDYIHQLAFQEKVFLLRLYKWRREKALHTNVPKEVILQNRHISTVLRSTKDGAGAFRSNRTLPENVWRKYAHEWQDLWKTRATEEERDLIESLALPVPDDPEQEWALELIYHLIKKQCLEHEISAALLMPKGDFNKLKSGGDDFDHSLLEGWRASLLGPNLVEWIRQRGMIGLDWSDGACKLTMQ